MKFELTDVSLAAVPKTEICSLKTMRHDVVFQVLSSDSIVYVLKLNGVVILMGKDKQICTWPIASCSDTEYEMLPLPANKSLTLTLSNKD